MAWCMVHGAWAMLMPTNLHVTLRAHICHVQALEQGAPSAMADLEAEIKEVKANIRLQCTIWCATAQQNNMTVYMGVARAAWPIS